MQLHRDSTVQSLTSIPVIRNGVLASEDSPLVAALQLGHVLVLDEADKAPVHVVMALKSLVESGELDLGDGRVLRRSSSDAAMPSNVRKKPALAAIHPNFRLIILANRPGYPFMGNDFYKAIGDCFSCHPVDNLDHQSQLAILRQVAPNLAEKTVTQLMEIFGQLRKLVDAGITLYPYSTRELLQVARHLNRFPSDSLSSAIRNVFDFDLMDPTMATVLGEALRVYGVSLTTGNAILASSAGLEMVTVGDILSSTNVLASPSEAKSLPLRVRPMDYVDS